MDKNNWTYKKLADVFDLQMGKTPSRDNSSYWGGKNTWVSIADLQHKYIDSSKENITDIAISESNIKKVRKGTVIMSFKLTVGRCAIAAKDLFTNEAIMAFTPLHQDILSSEYIYYYLKGYRWIGANKAVMGKTLNKKSISSNIFAYPPLAEQERIVAELDLLTSIIDKKKAQLKELDQLAQSIFYDMFGDPITNEKGWEMDFLSNVCETVTDFVAAGSFADLRKNVEYIDVPDYAQLIRTVDLKNGFLKKAFVYVNKHAFDYLWRVNLDRDAIVLPNVGVNCGEVYYVTPSLLPYDNNVLGPNAILVRSNRENHIYLSFFFRSQYFNSQIKQITNAVGQPKFNKTELKKLYVILPPLPLQQEFADKVEAIERQKSLIQQSIVETQTLFDSRMDYWFG